MSTNQASEVRLQVVENDMNPKSDNAPAIYHFNGQPVRIIDDNGEPWFCLSEIGKILEIAHVRNFMRSKACDEEGVRQIHSLTEGGWQDVTYISEPNLYALTLRSDKDTAKPFRRWVTHDLLPSLRKTGTYTVGQENRQADGQDPILATLQTIMEVRRSQLNLETRTSGIEHRLDEVEAELKMRKANALALPPPEGPDVVFTVKERCRLAIDRLVSLSGLSHGHCWREMYRRYEVSTGKSLYNATINKEGSTDQVKFDSKLDYIDKKGDIRVLYNLIHQAITKAAKGDLSLC